MSQKGWAAPVPACSGTNHKWRRPELSRTPSAPGQQRPLMSLHITLWLVSRQLPTAACLKSSPRLTLEPPYHHLQVSPKSGEQKACLPSRTGAIPYTVRNEDSFIMTGCKRGRHVHQQFEPFLTLSGLWLPRSESVVLSDCLCSCIFMTREALPW